MKRITRFGLLAIVCLSFMMIGSVERVLSQSASPGFLRQGAQWWEADPQPALSTAQGEFVDAAASNCNDFPGSPPSPEWWAISWMAQIDNNLEIVYRNWCDQDVRVTNQSSADLDPSFDPLGTRIAFSTNRDGNYEIYTVKPDGSDLQRITNNALNDRTPDWSSKNQIAFSSGSSTVDREIWTMNTDGSALAQLTNNDVHDVYPIWTPDGTQIFWVRISEDGENGELWRMNSDGSNPTRLTSPLPYLADPRISPDGLGIIMDADSTGDGPVDLLAMNSDGSNLRVLKASNYDSGAPPNTVYEYWAGTWLLDGSGVIYNTLEYVLSGDKYNLASSANTFLCFDMTRCAERKFSASLYNFGPDIVNRDPFAPGSQLQRLPEYTLLPNLELSWFGKDVGVSGLAYLNLEYRRESMANWEAVPGFENGSSDLSGRLALQFFEPGKISFRMRVTDQAGNTEPYPANDAAEVSTTLIADWLSGRLTDGRGVPLALQPVSVQPIGMITGVTNVDGEFMIPISSHGQFSINDQWLINSSPLRSQLYAKPADSLIRSGDFEGQALSDWISASATIDSEEVIVGEQSMLLSPNCDAPACLQTVEPRGADSLPQQAAMPIVASLSQSVTIPLSMTQPTLSFLYKITSSEQVTAFFEITIASEITQSGSITTTPPVTNVLASSLVSSTITTTQILSQSQASDWGLGWLDLSQWQGQSITVTFAVRVAEGSDPLLAYLDEISLGSWKTPYPKTISPLKIEYGPAVTLTITGENFINLPIVKLNGIELTDVTQVDENRLQVKIPQNFAPGVYFVQVINPEGQNAVAPTVLFIGKQNFLPIIAR